MRKKVELTLILLISFVVFATFSLSRQIFFFKYEPEYYENYYYFSQWNVPNSSRGISDGDLYKFVGYQLFYGENPFDLNFEVPPFVKYFFGLTEATIGNPYWVTIFFYFGCLAAMYLLAEELFKNRRVSLISVLFLVTTPYVATQVRETMLDLPLMFLFLAHALLFTKYIKTKSFPFLVAAGVLLGLATGTKIGVYTPLALILGVGLIIALKKYKEALLYPFVVSGGYVLSYFSYFIRHPNPIPWIRLHEKPLNFYLGGGLSNVDRLNQWRGIFINTYQGWWEPGKITTLGDWSPLLPVGVLAAIYIFARSVKKKDFVWTYLSLFLVAILIVHTFIPFFPRYLVIAIPFLILLVIKAFRKRLFLVLLLILLNLPFFKSSMYAPHPGGDTQAVARFLSTRAYRELYRSIAPQDRRNIPEDEFISLNESFFEGLKARKVEAEVKDVVVEGSLATANFMLTYRTQYGEAVNTKTFTFRRVNNQWKLVWDWGYLWEGYGPGVDFLVEGKAPVPKKVVYIIPRLMYGWTEHLWFLSDVTGLSTIEIDARIRRVVPDDFPRFVGYLNEDVSEETALNIKGARLVEDDSSPGARVFLVNKEGERNEILLVKPDEDI